MVSPMDYVSEDHSSLSGMNGYSRQDIYMKKCREEFGDSKNFMDEIDESFLDPIRKFEKLSKRFIEIKINENVSDFHILFVKAKNILF